ncbi:MAG: pantoate--beta-alanine ligase, partial [Tannerella sp.]|nr:pantoate--beta-alanine ligase [Tannerella sp.]
MRTIFSINELKALLFDERRSGKTIGFVPTMGALHEGHLSLVKQCKEENDICVVSVFVNPTQFNDKNDLKAYPRTLEKDCELLGQLCCDCVFAPSEDEMYPEPDTRVFELGPVAEVMEGEKRPGHFNGVAQIVSK